MQSYRIKHSYGAFLVQEFLKQFGNLADANAVLNCRLDIDDVVWKGGQNGKAYQYNSTGENPTEMDIPAEINKQEAKNNAVLGVVWEQHAIQKPSRMQIFQKRFLLVQRMTKR